MTEFTFAEFLLSFFLIAVAAGGVTYSRVQITRRRF